MCIEFKCAGTYAYTISELAIFTKKYTNKTPPEKTDTPGTGDNSLISIYITTMVLAMAVIVVLKKKRIW